MRKCILLIVFFTNKFVFGQHNMYQMHEKTDTTIMASDTMKMNGMNHAFSLNLPMNRNGSGTGWLPDASTMYGYGIHYKKWMFMFHNNVFFRYNHQDITNKGNRGGEKTDAPAWLMFMGQRKIGNRGLFRFNSMISLDPITVGVEGYPLLYQSGETYKGKRLVDKQHPHDLFSELSLAYTYMVSKNVDITTYIGYPGEPALGPVAFMHRVSALNNPDAPLSHHWQDATHVNYGVGTLGIRYSIFKVEGSIFTGREPDENRYDFDKPRFDSYSYRLSCNPTKQLALQVSQAYLKSPEVAEPGKNVTRSTASIIHHLPFKRENRYLATSAIWGLNTSDHNEHSFLLESNLQLDKNAVYGRYEYVQKGASELDLPQFSNGSEAIFNIHALTIGLNRVLIRQFGYNLAAGLQGSVYVADARLNILYGQNPVAGEVYLRLYPHLMRMGKMGNKGKAMQMGV
ncbi:MAG: hypothetical protein ACXVO9_05120 [Bacteroidia bacterium]